MRTFVAFAFKVSAIFIGLNEKGKTIIVVSHDADFQKVAKRNYLIEDGMLKGF